MKLIVHAELWCHAGAHDTDVAVQLREWASRPQSRGLTVCPVCLIQAVGVLGLNVEMAPADAFALLKMTTTPQVKKGI